MKTFPGKNERYEVSEDSTLGDVLSMFKADYSMNSNGSEFTLQGRECRLNGERIEFNEDRGMNDGDVITFTKKKDSSFDESVIPSEDTPVEDTPVEDVVPVPVVKRKDIFTKEFVEGSSVEELTHALFLYALDMKRKNRFISARRHELLNEPKVMIVDGKELVTLVKVIDDELYITSEDELFPGVPLMFKALEGETEKELIIRWNTSK